MVTVSVKALWASEDTGITWYDPFPVVTPDETFMLVQPITGSDVYGSVMERRTTDEGRSWSSPLVVPPFATTARGSEEVESVVGPTPIHHPPTDTVVAIGTNAVSVSGRLVQPTTQRHVVYAVRQATGQWGELKRLTWDDPRATGMYASSCLQHLVLDSGDLLIGVQFLPEGGDNFRATTLRCRFDGAEVTVLDTGRAVGNPVGRGLFEPSVVRHGDRYWMTLRAEDGQGYVAQSTDGLTWDDPQPWAWQDGAALEMSTTQQHWLSRGEELYLAYCRRTAENHAVVRWRAPLHLAQVDLGQRRLVRDTEQVVLPLLGDGTATPNRVPYYGNFAVTLVSPNEAWVTDCALAPWDDFAGTTYLSRVVWPDALQAL